MKKIFYRTVTAVVLLGLITATGCKKDEEDPAPTYAKPTISITSPEIPAGGLVTTTGTTTAFKIQVDAEAGLSSLKVGTTTIKTFAGTEKSEEVSYDFLAQEVGSLTLSFTVEDAVGQKASVDVAVTIEEGEDLGYLLIDFAGDASASQEKVIVDWDIRTLYTFNVSGSHGSSATAEVVNSQAQLSFAQANPDPGDNSKVFKLVKSVNEGFDNWGGWAHLIFGLGDVIPAGTVSSLPTWDNTNAVTVPGTKVIKVDAYYDATVDPAFTWSQLTELVDIWNADPTMGYKVDIAIAAYEAMGNTEGGHDGNMFIGYTAYIGEPNTWVTLTFDMADEGRAANFYSVSGDEVHSPDKVNCLKLMPSPGYIETDLNPVYFKNLRIVDVE